MPCICWRYVVSNLLGTSNVLSEFERRSFKLGCELIRAIKFATSCVLSCIHPCALTEGSGLVASMISSLSCVLVPSKSSAVRVLTDAYAMGGGWFGAKLLASVLVCAVLFKRRRLPWLQLGPGSEAHESESTCSA